MRKNLQQLFEEFMYECEFVRKIKPKTLKDYFNTFHLLIKLVPECSLENLDKSFIIQFYKTLQERKRIVGKGIVKSGIKRSTVATYRFKLSPFFSWLVNEQQIKANPFNEMHFIAPRYENKKYLNKNNIEKILTAIHFPKNNNILIVKRNVVIFYIFLFCGLRKEELLSLKILDIDLGKKLLTIRGENSKSGRTRSIPLHSTILMHLKDYLICRAQYRTPYLIISSVKDEKLTDFGLNHLVKNLKFHSGVNFHLHQLRHTFAVNFLRTSNNVVKLKQLLGHTDISITAIYLRCLPTHELRGDIESMHVDTFL